ncbi:MAG TPA: hypothetical protein VI031_06525 [Pyrinomonadaceae bacterium]
MKRIITLSLVLLLTGTSLVTRAKQATSPFETFWQTFRTAVGKHDVEGVARLSRFPISMSYGIPSIRTKAQLSKRYRQVFNEQTDAAVCFAKAKPEMNAENPKQFTVACPDAAGNEVVIYHFEQTRTGWKFTGLDNLNE